MPTVYLKSEADKKVLLVDGKVAINPACCRCPPRLHVVWSADWTVPGSSHPGVGTATYHGEGSADVDFAIIGGNCAAEINATADLVTSTCDTAPDTVDCRISFETSIGGTNLSVGIFFQYLDTICTLGFAQLEADGDTTGLYDTVSPSNTDPLGNFGTVSGTVTTSAL